MTDLSKGLRESWASEFQRVTYTEAVEILEEAVRNGQQFEYPVHWGLTSRASMSATSWRSTSEACNPHGLS